MYKFALQKDVKEASRFCEKILKQMQIQLKEYFTFQFELIGSGGKKLVTQNENDPFDLDYNIIIQKDKQNLIDNPKKIRQLFIDKFNNLLVNEICGYKYASNSTSVIKLKKIKYGTLMFSWDCAIMIESDNGFIYKLIYNKSQNIYIRNMVKKSKDYKYRLQFIKQNNLWIDFKKRYLFLKNLHLKNNDNVPSFSIFLETLNEFEYR